MTDNAKDPLVDKLTIPDKLPLHAISAMRLCQIIDDKIIDAHKKANMFNFHSSSIQISLSQDVFDFMSKYLAHMIDGRYSDYATEDVVGNYRGFPITIVPGELTIKMISVLNTTKLKGELNDEAGTVKPGS